MFCKEEGCEFWVWGEIPVRAAARSPPSEIRNRPVAGFRAENRKVADLLDGKGFGLEADEPEPRGAKRYYLPLWQ